MRKNKARRIQAIKNGTYDPENTPQRGQPEPEHTWDYDNLVENPIYYAPDYLKEAMADYWDDVNEVMRKKWKEYMGIKGNQRYFKNWTPPGMEPPPE
ncbi:tsf, partial [Symbiodinium sp. KB8]